MDNTSSNGAGIAQQASVFYCSGSLTRRPEAVGMDILTAEAPGCFCCAFSIPAAFTQLLMMLASSLRTCVTDGGSAGLCPLEKAEQGELVSGGSSLPLARGKPSQGTEGQRLSVLYLIFMPWKKLTVWCPQRGWEAGWRALSSPLHWWLVSSALGLNADG